jgi:hypothetical protein
MGLDAVLSEKEGRPIPRVVIMACITPAGSKDCVEKIAEEWLAQIKRQALNGTYSLEWSQFFHASFEEWKKGNELPREGTPIITWAMATNEARKRLRALGITTVEDLGEIPDSNLGGIGLDGRYLRDLARGWITEAKDKGANAKALADANVRIADLESSISSYQQRIQRLETKLLGSDADAGAAAPAPPRRGRKTQTEEAA